MSLVPAVFVLKIHHMLHKVAVPGLQWLCSASEVMDLRYKLLLRYLPSDGSDEMGLMRKSANVHRVTTRDHGLSISHSTLLRSSRQLGLKTEISQKRKKHEFHNKRLVGRRSGTQHSDHFLPNGTQLPHQKERLLTVAWANQAAIRPVEKMKRPTVRLDCRVSLNSWSSSWRRVRRGVERKKTAQKKKSTECTTFSGDSVLH